MAFAEKITCDVCGTEKGESNHWMLWTRDGSLSGGRKEMPEIRFLPWHGELYREYRHLCGESCAGKLLAKAINEWREKSVCSAPIAVQTPVPHVHRLHRASGSAGETRRIETVDRQMIAS